MKKRVLAMVMALCIAAVHTVGAYAAADEVAPQISTEESAEAENSAEASEEAEISYEQAAEPIAPAEEGAETLNEGSFVEDASVEEDEESPDSSEAAYETATERDNGFVANEPEEAYEVEYSSEINTEMEVIEEILGEGSNEALDEIEVNDASEAEAAEIIEDVDTLEAVNSAKDHIIGSIIDDVEWQSDSNEAMAVNVEENINKLIDYVMEYGTKVNNNSFVRRISMPSTTSDNLTFYPYIVVNLSRNFISFNFSLTAKNSSLSSVIFEMDYYIDSKEFRSIGGMISFEPTGYSFPKANINPETYLPEQELHFESQMGTSIPADQLDKFSNAVKDLALASFDNILYSKPKLCLYALGFNKYIMFDFVNYYMPSTSFTHTGKEIIPPVDVSYMGFDLEEGVHYELDYENTTGVGYGTVTINATGGLSGSKELIYAILPAASKKVTIYNVAQGIKVTWLPVEGATRYKVYRDGELIKTTSVLEITDGDVKYRSGEKFTYKVVATAKSVGDSLVARTGTYYRLMPVGIKTLTNSGAGKMTVTYDKSPGSSGYVVRYGLKSDMSDAKVITVKGEDTLSRTFSNLTKGKTYYVQVRTYKIDNGIRYYSGYCTTKTVKIMK